MNRTYKRLTVAAVAKLVKRRAPGMYPDGDGLCLAISPAGVTSWSYRFMIDGRAREMGLGPLRDVSLEQARQLAYQARQLKRQGIDPIEARRAKQLDIAVATAKTMSFEACAKGYIAAHRAGWKNAKHAQQWLSSLETYVYPVFGKLPVDAIDVGLVLKVLEPIWHAKTETAARLRGRIEAVLDWATAREYRSRDVPNPARWKAHLENLLAPKSKVAPTKNHAALDYRELPAFMAELRRHHGHGFRALDFAILTVTRTKDTRGAVWSEFDLGARMWTVPAARMKGGRVHKVPLSDAALAILERQAGYRQGDFVFPGATLGRPLGTNALLQALQRLGRSDLTAHGFRSSFTDWCAESTAFSAEVREMALAHKIPNKVEAAYRRGDLFAKRRQLMAAWAQFCATPEGAGSVVPLRRPASSASFCAAG